MSPVSLLAALRLHARHLARQGVPTARIAPLADVVASFCEHEVSHGQDGNAKPAQRSFHIHGATRGVGATTMLCRLACEWNTIGSDVLAMDANASPSSDCTGPPLRLAVHLTSESRFGAREYKCISAEVEQIRQQVSSIEVGVFIDNFDFVRTSPDLAQLLYTIQPDLIVTASRASILNHTLPMPTNYDDGSNNCRHKLLKPIDSFIDYHNYALSAFCRDVDFKQYYNVEQPLTSGILGNIAFIHRAGLPMWKELGAQRILARRHFKAMRDYMLRNRHDEPVPLNESVRIDHALAFVRYSRQTLHALLHAGDIMATRIDKDGNVTHVQVTCPGLYMDDPFT